VIQDFAPFFRFASIRTDLEFQPDGVLLFEGIACILRVEADIAVVL
jgi:hypothetical protein